MRKPVMIIVTLIFFETNGIKKYIKGTSSRDFDEKRIATYTENIDQAHYYDDESAKNLLEILHNPWNRIFKTETKEMPDDVKRKKANRFEEDLVD